MISFFCRKGLISLIIPHFGSSVDEKTIDSDLAAFFGPAGLLVLEADQRDLAAPLAAFKDAGWGEALASLDETISAVWKKRYTTLSSSVKSVKSASFSPIKSTPDFSPEMIARAIPPLIERLSCAVPPNAIEDDPYDVVIPHLVSVVNAAWIYRIMGDETEEQIELIERLTVKALETIALHRAYLNWRQKKENGA